MRALAILGPNASGADVRRFATPGAEITPAGRITPTDGPDAAVIFGGDGTVHHQLAALVEGQIPLLVVPKGSGNDFAHALGIRNEADALSAWKAFCAHRENVRSIDVGVITSTADTPKAAGDRRLAAGEMFCCIAGAGLDSEANRHANAMPRWLRARGGYVVGVVRALARFRAQPMRLALEGMDGATRILDGPATMVAIGNASSYGRGMRIAPRARLDDGLLDICFIRRVGPLRLLRFFPRVYTGAHLDMPEVEYAQTSRVRLESESPLDIYADGEFVGQTPVEVTVRPAALRVICHW